MAKSNRTRVDKYPNLEEKAALSISPTITQRHRHPTNEFTTSKHPAMVWDYSRQRQVWPNGDPKALIESSSHTGHKYDTMNKSGRPFALGNMDMGGAPDTQGDSLWVTPPKKKMLR